MSMNHSLFRVREKLGEREISFADTDVGAHLFPPFGPLEQVRERLLSIPGFAAIPIQQEEWLAQSIEKFKREGRVKVPPQYRQPVSMNLDLDGRKQLLHLWGDPVERICIERSAPWDLVEVAEIFSELAPFAVADMSRTAFVDIDRYAPRDPRPRGPVFTAAEAIPSSNRRALLQHRWSLQTLDSPFEGSPMFPWRDFVVVTAHGSISSLDASTGRTLWTRDWNRGVPCVTATGAALVVAGNHPQIFGLDPADGSVLWRCPVKGRISRPAVLSENRVALGKEAGQVLTLSTIDGAIIWTRDLGSPVWHRPVPVGDQLLVICRFGTLHCLDARTGERCSTQTCGYLGAECVGPFVVLHREREIVRLTLPDLHHAVPLIAVPHEQPTGFFQQFMKPVGEDLLAFGLAKTDREGLLRVVEVSSGRSVFEVPIDSDPSQPAVIDARRWACVLRPFRRDRGRKASLIVVDTEAGCTIHKEPLDSTGWNGDFVVSGGGRLFVRHGKKLTAFAVSPPA